MRVDFQTPVLVVDDYITMARILCSLLTQFGFQNVFTAADGAEALVLMKSHRFGLVISDWNMEPMTGYELLKDVRNDETLKDTPFIMVTAESKSENAVAALRAGVDGYIIKPFNAATLKAKIEAVLGELAPTPHHLLVTQTAYSD